MSNMTNWVNTYKNDSWAVKNWKYSNNCTNKHHIQRRLIRKTTVSKLF